MEQNEPSALIKETAVLFGRSTRLVDPMRLRMWEEQGITFPQLRILFRVRMHPDIDLRTLADGLAISPSAASQQVDKLVERGLLWRTEDPQDRRRLRLQLTPQAEEAVGEYSRTVTEYISAILARLSQKDLKELHRLLGTLEELNSPPPPLPSSVSGRAVAS
ncbi:MAG: MarR family transcriptional regulator [Dehalococcoidia bacterium]|nr:MarR family transcriptional regulator [Dehalococcoidia bacterium]HRC62149.1 MarR family transcriptional regulator [Dehalococcoidia bacterium]